LVQVRIESMMRMKVAIGSAGTRAQRGGFGTSILDDHAAPGAAEIVAILRNDPKALDRLRSDDLLMSSNQNLIFKKERIFGFFQRRLIQLEKLARTISKSMVKGDPVFLIGNQPQLVRVALSSVPVLGSGSRGFGPVLV
jgi:hypothetical protein